MRLRLNDQELYLIQSSVYRRLYQFYGKEITEEAIELYRLLIKLVDPKVGKPSKVVVTTEKLQEVLMNNNHLLTGYRTHVVKQ